MSNIIFHIECETIINSLAFHKYIPALSHDEHLQHWMVAALSSGHRVFCRDVGNYTFPNSELIEIFAFEPKLLARKLTLSELPNHFDVNFTAYPELHALEYYIGATKVAYYPALYLVEMPDHFIGEKFEFLMYVAQRIVDVHIFQNERQREFFRALALSIAGVEIEKNSIVCPHGLIETPNKLGANNISREEIGFSKENIVLINGGGAWRWTDFNGFLSDFVKYSISYPNTQLRLIVPGLSQNSNCDHDSYIKESKSILTRYFDYIKQKKLPSNIYYIDSWEEATNKLEDLYAISDVGISVNPPTLEFFLSRRVRVLDYIKNGLHLLLSEGDSFAEEFRSVDYATIVHTIKNKGDYENSFLCLEKKFAEISSGKLRSIAAQSNFMNLDQKKNAIEQIENKDFIRVLHAENPMNYIRHKTKQDIVKTAIKQLLGL